MISSQTNFLQAVTMGYNSSDSRPQCIGAERKALLQIKENLIDDHFPGRLWSWVGQDCCKWAGVGCNNRTGNVVKLDLGANPYDLSSPLSGKLSPSLLDLNHLNYLNLSYNTFEASVLSSIGSLKELKYLDLSHMDPGQMVPPQLGNLSNLYYLDLSINSMFLASDLNWISSLTSLRYLNLGGMDLTKASTSWLKTINLLPALSELYLSFCNLEYPPSFSPIENLTSLSVIDLSHNVLISEIPPWLFNITTLVDLDLSTCIIAGRVTHLPWYNLRNLESLDLNSNFIRNDISSFYNVLSERSNTSLRKINLERNYFSGQLGESLGWLTRLTSLRLYYNLITGEIPSSIGRLSFLEELTLSFNNMTGSIPTSIGDLSSLVLLDLSNSHRGKNPIDNIWKGKLTKVHFKKLSKLKDLFISSSNGALVFDMARDWIPTFNLETISVFDCVLGPAIPPWLQTQTELTGIYLLNAHISDPIPDWFWNLTTQQVIVLDLSGNEIGGMLPYSLEFYNNAHVDLSGNQLYGPIPLWSGVTHLTLRNNSFSGPIPMEIGTIMWESIVLDLSLNVLNGTIPKSISKIKYLETLDLSHNSLSGTIPKSISKIKYLKTLDLSHNSLSGKILDKWDTLRELIYLDLSNNDLLGEIPRSICSSADLYWLDLSDNSFIGEMLSLQNCKSLMGLNLGGNRLSGDIPRWMGKLKTMELLKLGMNNLSGEIPQELCHVSNLHALDLSHNNLSGIIPACISNLSVLTGDTSPNSLHSGNGEMDFVVKGRLRDYLEILYLLNIIDLSSNNLTGEIPEEIFNLILLGTLNFSRNQLSGKIPEKIG